jgi:hypothetical protein
MLRFFWLKIFKLGACLLPNRLMPSQFDQVKQNSLKERKGIASYDIQILEGDKREKGLILLCHDTIIWTRLINYPFPLRTFFIYFSCSAFLRWIICFFFHLVCSYGELICLFLESVYCPGKIRQLVLVQLTPALQ